jgi:DNA-3-methyladenine glycosylase
MRYRRLARSELPIDTAALARFLIGKAVVRRTSEGVLSGLIVETEAYVVGDAAGHAYRGVTPRTRSLFLEPGRAYVYLSHGRSYMLNVSSEAAGVGAGVLIRALEPLEGITIMQRNRRTERLRDLTRGPGRLAQALEIGPWADGLDLCHEGAALAGARRARPRRNRTGRQDRPLARNGAAAAVPCSRQSVRQRPKVAQRLGPRPWKSLCPTSSPQGWMSSSAG